MNKFLVAPSILSADFSKLGDEIIAIEKAGADWIHIDVMDGHFVPNLTFGAPVVQSIRKVTNLPFDVHLMIDQPERYVDDFVQAGADYLTIHVEATKAPEDVLRKIGQQGVKPGITLRPGTAVSELFPFLPLTDLVLIMTVEPGFGGQSFMKDQLEKISLLRKEMERIGHSSLIEVDGGINQETASLCYEADVLVAGSFVFKQDYQTAIHQLKQKG
ncbi:MAG: ribulose-phosphate 3-epimerase [Bdellovibrionales bacterium]|nr:ribulose-phosphate 3-epimerase [Bdellovibrionales bacterium]